MTEYTLIEALLLGLLYAYTWTEMCTWPIPKPSEIGFMGAILGLAYGEVSQGCIIGATIGLINIGNFAYGASVPSDTPMAGVIAIPMAIKFGLTAGESLVIAVPFGVLGALINNARRAFAGTFWRQSQKAISERKYNKLFTFAFIEPIIMNLVTRCLPVTLLLYLLGSAGGNAIANMPAWLSSAFTMMGLMLPGVGLVMCISIMGNKSMLPYAVIGFFLLGRFKFTMVEVAVMGIVLGFLHTLFTATPQRHLPLHRAGPGRRGLPCERLPQHEPVRPQHGHPRGQVRRPRRHVRLYHHSGEPTRIILLAPSGRGLRPQAVGDKLIFPSLF